MRTLHVWSFTCAAACAAAEVTCIVVGSPGVARDDGSGQVNRLPLAWLLRKVSWNLIDQTLSAASNFALAIAVAHFVSAAEFGAFAIAFMTYGIAVAATKSVIGQPLQIRYSSAAATGPHHHLRQATGTALGLSIPAATAIAAIGLLTSGSVSSSLLALAVVLPALLVQDTCRMAMFTIGKPAWAAAIDAIWTVAQFALIALVFLTGVPHDVWMLILLWGLSAALSAVAGLALLRSLPRLRSTLPWFVAQRSLIRYLFPEYLLGLGAAQLGLVLVGVVASAETVGSLRAAQVLLGPLGIVGAAALQFAVPEMSSRPQLTSRQRARFVLGINAALGIITIGYLVVLLLIPDRVGVVMFGDSWAGAALVLLPMGLASLASSQSYGPSAALYALDRTQWTFRISLIRGPLTLTALLVAGALYAGPGAAWALFGVEAVVLPAWAFAVRRALRARTKVTLDPDQAKPDAALT